MLPFQTLSQEVQDLVLKHQLNHLSKMPKEDLSSWQTVPESGYGNAQLQKRARAGTPETAREQCEQPGAKQDGCQNGRRMKCSWQRHLVCEIWC